MKLAVFAIGFALTGTATAKPLASDCAKAREVAPAARVWAKGAGCAIEWGEEEKRLDALLRGLARRPESAESWAKLGAADYQDLIRGRDWAARELGSSRLGRLPYVGDIVFRAFQRPAVQASSEARNFLLRSALCTSDFEAEGHFGLLAKSLERDPVAFLRALDATTEFLQSSPNDRDACPEARRIVKEGLYVPAVLQAISRDGGKQRFPASVREAVAPELEGLRKLPSFRRFANEMSRAFENR